MLQKPENELQPKLSCILKEELINIPQIHGAFNDGNGKYCVIAAVARYFGYDVEVDKGDSAVLATKSSAIPLTIIKRIEDCVPFTRIDEYPRCNCKTKNYFHCSLTSLLIHLNDYHEMTFRQIGEWLEGKGL